MRYILFTFFLFLSQLNALDTLQKIDISKKAITITNATTLKKARHIAKKLQNNDIYIYKTTTTQTPYFLLYAVNIHKKNLKSNLNIIRKYFKGAYLSSDKRIRTLASNNFKKNILIMKEVKKNITPVIQKLKIKNNKTILKKIVKKIKPKTTPKQVVKLTPKKKPIVVQEIKTPKVIKKTNIKSVITKKIISKEIVQKNTWINKNKKSITLHHPIYYGEAQFLAKIYKYYDTYIYSGKYNFTVNIVNIDAKDVKQLLDLVSQRVPTARLTQTKTINYFAKQQNSTKGLFTAAKPMPKVNKKVFKKVDNKIFLYAKQEFNNKHYQKAIIFLTDFINLNNNHVEANFLLGRAYYITRQFELAFTTYQKILIINEDLERVRLELAQTYLALKMTKESLQEFNTLLTSNNIPPQVKENIKKRIAFIKSLERNYQLQFMLAVNSVTDDNINNAPAIDVFKIFPFLEEYGIITRTVAEDLFADYLTKKEAKSKQYTVAVNHKYKINDDTMLDTTISQLSQRYDNTFKSKNLNILTIGTSIAKTSKEDRLAFSIATTTIETYDAISTKLKPFMKSNIIGVDYSHNLAKSFSNNFGLKISDKLFRDSATSDKESRSIIFNSTQQLITKKYGIFSTSVFATKEKSFRGNRTDVDNINYGISLSNSYNINKRLSALLATSINRKIYKSMDINYKSIREDTTNLFSLGLNYKFTKNLSGSINITKTRATSTQGAFSYRKGMQTFGLAYSF